MSISLEMSYCKVSQLLNRQYLGRIRNVFIKSYTFQNSSTFSKLSKSCLLQNQHKVLKVMSCQNSTSSGEHQPTAEVQKLSSKDKLKRAVKDYGATVIIFHISLSLMSLGVSYLIISRWAFSIIISVGLNMNRLY